MILELVLELVSELVLELVLELIPELIGDQDGCHLTLRNTQGVQTLKFMRPSLQEYCDD